MDLIKKKCDNVASVFKEGTEASVVKKNLKMMEQRPSPSIYPANLTELLAVSYQHNTERLSIADGFGENFAEPNDRSSSPVSTIEEDSQSAFGVDLTGKATNLAGKSFTIAAILGLTNAEEDAMNLSVQERLQSQRQLQSYLYAGHDIQRLNDGFCRGMVPPGMRQGRYFKDLGEWLLKA